MQTKPGCTMERKHFVATTQVVFVGAEALNQVGTGGLTAGLGRQS